MKPLSYEDMAGLNRLLILRGVTVTQKASTVSMTTDTKGHMKVAHETGWLSVSDEELTVETQAAIDDYVGSLA